MKTRFTILFFFCLTLNFTFCQEGNIEISRLCQSLNKLGETRFKVDTLDEISYLYFSVNLDSSDHYAKKAGELAMKLNYKKGIGASLNMRGSVEKARYNYDKSEAYFTEALKVRIQLGDPKSIVSVYANLGMLAEERGKLLKAIDWYESGMEVLKNIKEDAPLKQMIRMYNNLGRANKLIGKFKEAEYYYEKILELSETLKDPVNAAVSYMSLGNLYAEEEFVDTAKTRKYLTKSLDLFTIHGETKLKAQCFINLGNLYFNQKEFKKAMAYYASAKEKSDYLNGEQLTKIMRNEGSVYHGRQAFDKALEIYQEALASYQEMEKTTEIAALYNDIGNVYLDKGDYEKANIHLNKCLDIANENKLLSLKTLVLDSIKKVKERELFEKELERKAMISSGLIGFVSFLIITLFLFYLNRKKRQLAEQNVLLAKKDIDVLISNQALKTTSARLEGIEQERKRIGNALHDQIGAMISAAKLYFAPMDQQFNNLDEKEKDKYLKANKILDEAYEEVRRISHNMASPSLTSLGLVGELDLLANRIKDAKQLNIQVIAHQMNERLDNQLEMKLYQIIQELITNVLKHANATEVSIELNHFEDLINIMVQDNGIGFDEKTSKIEKKGTGLDNIKERVEGLKGTFIIDSKKGSGTTISIDVPI